MGGLHETLPSRGRSLPAGPARRRRPADISYFTEPLRVGLQKVSAAVSAREYRLDAARNVYAAYASRIFKGRLPPLIHAVVVVETTVDANGEARDVKLVRGPSHAPDVSAAVMQMIRRVTLPAPAAALGAAGLKFHRGLARPQGRPLPARRPDRRPGLTRRPTCWR